MARARLTSEYVLRTKHNHDDFDQLDEQRTSFWLVRQWHFRHSKHPSASETGFVDVIVVYKVDCLARNLGDFSRIVDVLDAASASFVSFTQAFNTTASLTQEIIEGRQPSTMHLQSFARMAGLPLRWDEQMVVLAQQVQMFRASA